MAQKWRVGHHLSPSALAHSHACTFPVLFRRQILLWPLVSPSLRFPRSAAPSFWGTTVLYRHSYCSTNSVMCIYCSICEIGGTSWQAYYYSITEAGRFHSHRAINVSDRNITSHQFQKTDSLQYCMLYIILYRKISPFLAEWTECKQSSSLVFNKKHNVMASRIYLSPNRSYLLMCCTWPTSSIRARHCHTSDLAQTWSICCHSAW